MTVKDAIVLLASLPAEAMNLDIPGVHIPQIVPAQYGVVTYRRYDGLNNEGVFEPAGTKHVHDYPAYVDFADVCGNCNP